jgi:hypothetical protein
VAVGLVFVTLLSACTSRGDNGVELSEFLDDTLISGRVVENTKACTVDAACHLRIEFADTTILALYGTGERPAPACEIPREVSDAAFGVEAGDVIDVVVSMCGLEGRYVRRLVR